jgi:glycine/D-amino acid oxidase-like deaminating enzyme
MWSNQEFDVVIVGGGFYGCCLALFLRSVTDSILIIEREPELLSRASRVNQARIHTGFHYPRSFVTALRSRELSFKFARDFAPAVADDFQMLYAIARRRSKVSAERFFRMFANMGAPIARATSSDAALFNPTLIEEVFACSEFAFDWIVLRDMLRERLERFGVEIRYECCARRVGGEGVVETDKGAPVRGKIVFNVTYSGINTLLLNSGFALLPFKHELTELALVVPPPELKSKAVTVMDGPFFSIMPYPSLGLYSLSHVRYTPHASWTVIPEDGKSPYEPAPSKPRASRWRHMMLDIQRYLPCCARLDYQGSIFDVKTILVRNENDDGRPILLRQHKKGPGFFSVMGGKIDNIYDLFEFVPSLDERLAAATDDYLMGRV